MVQEANINDNSLVTTLNNQPLTPETMLTEVITNAPTPLTMQRNDNSISCKEFLCPAPFNNPAELSNICAEGTAKLTPLDLTLALYIMLLD
jgi:hypothetical protein